MEKKSNTDDNLSKENNIDKLYDDNSKKRKQINELEKQIKKIKKKMDKNRENIQELCEHEWEREIVYGEPTSYECFKCGLWSRR